MVLEKPLAGCPPAVGGYLEPEEMMADVQEECHEAAEAYATLQARAALLCWQAQPRCGCHGGGEMEGPWLSLLVAGSLGCPDRFN